ncbi:iron-containing alcohol dehydrogenase [Candidatus Dependentiae bacterium]|nr:iron-containing alcohol dehydrogenase [Candidatus Dependentiae bacterium]
MKEIFQFFQPTTIIFGPGAVSEVTKLAAGLGKKALVITSNFWLKERKVLQKLSKNLVKNKVRHLYYPAVSPEPKARSVNSAVSLAQSEHVDLVIAIGGGSVLDVGKSIAILLKNFGRAERYLELDGSYKIRNKGVPFIAIPTTTGTGSEVTKNAVLFNNKTKMKRSIRSEFMFPTYAVIDPKLTVSLPQDLTALTGIDAFTHLIEGYLSKKSNILTDVFSVYGINLIKHSLPKACKDKAKDIDVRSKLSLASLLGGFALSNSSMGICHGLAGTLGSIKSIPHSAAVAILLPHVLVFMHGKLDKIKILSKILMKKSGTKSELRNWFRTFYKKIGLNHKLVDFDIKPEDLKNIAQSALKTNSIKGSPVSVKKIDLINILKKALAE